MQGCANNSPTPHSLVYNLSEVIYVLKGTKIGLVMVILLLVLCSCGTKETYVEETVEFDPQEPVTICFDIDGNFDDRHYSVNDFHEFEFTGAEARESAITKLLQEIEDQGGPENVTYEFVEWRGEGRDGALTRLRAELMAGAGPDVFVICQQQYSTRNLFKFVEKKMEENMFLPLDGYVEKSQFMDIDRMNQAVLSGGKNSKGRQMVIPLRYTFPVAVLPASKAELDLSQDYSLYDMLAGTDPALTSALASWRDEEGVLVNFSSAFGNKADYSNETLALSQEEFRELIHQLLEFNKGVNENQIGEMIKGVSLTDLWDFRLLISSEKWGKKPVTIIPLYNLQGGVTAKICDYAAVNRNTKNPAGAFRVVDYISSESAIQSSDFHMYMNSHGLPIYDELMQETSMLPYDKKDKAKENIYFDQTDWQAMVLARNKLDSADFPTELDLEIDWLLGDIRNASDDSQKDKLIDECYTKMRMLLGES